MPTLIITVDPECCRCSTKLQKILCYIQERCEFVIEKVVYEKDRMIVSGLFDAFKLSYYLRCKAGRIIKNIEIAPPLPPPPPPPPPLPEPKCKLICPYPYPYPCPQPGAWSPCSSPAPHFWCQSKPPSPPPPPPKQPPCQCPTWSSSCYCGGCPPYVPPLPMSPYPMVVCDDSPPYGAFAVMSPRALLLLLLLPDAITN